MLIAGFLEKFKDNKTVKTIFYGLRPAVVGMLAVSLITIIKSTFLIPDAVSFLSSINFIKIAVFAVLLFLVLKFKKHPVLYIAMGAVCGIIFKF